MIPIIVVGSIVSYLLIGGCIAGYWLAENGKAWDDYGTDHAWVLLFLWAIVKPLSFASSGGVYLAEKAKERHQKRLALETHKRFMAEKQAKELAPYEAEVEEIVQRRAG